MNSPTYLYRAISGGEAAFWPALLILWLVTGPVWNLGPLGARK